MNGSVPVVSRAKAISVTIGIVATGVVMVKAPSTYPSEFAPLYVSTRTLATPDAEFGIEFNQASGIANAFEVATPVYSWLYPPIEKVTLWVNDALALDIATVTSLVPFTSTVGVSELMLDFLGIVSRATVFDAVIPTPLKFLPPYVE